MPWKENPPTFPPILLVPCVIAAFITFDQIVKTEHDLFFSDWEQDGEPRGFFWRPPRGLSGFGSGWGLTAQSRWLAWLFQTPPWARSNPEVLGLFRRYRICVLIWNLGFIVWLAIIRLT